jgi:hypothetical protein
MIRIRVTGILATGILGLALLLTSGALWAQNNQGFYLGAGIGDHSAEIDDLDDVDFDSGNNARKAFAGWRFNRFVAVQAEYTDFGDSTRRVGPLAFTANTKGLTPSLIGTLPLGPIELFGKAGIIFYDFEIDTPVGELVDSSGEDAVLGVGIGATLLDHLSLTAEYERIDIDELDDADAFWLSAAWRF